MGGGADDPSYDSFSSRWGIKGSSEVSEGLTAVYKFETRIGQGGTASQGTNQLYTGLSGGFGSLTLGKQVGATYNHTGAIRDISNWHSYGDVGSRISNALSYSYAAESFSMQVAAIMDADTDTDGAVDQVEFGMTVGLGDIGKVAIGYEKVEDSMMTTPVSAMYTTGKDADGNDTMVEVMEIMVTIDAAHDENNDHLTGEKGAEKLTADGLNSIVKTADGKYEIGTVDADTCKGDDANCIEVVALVSSKTNTDTTIANQDSAPTNTITPNNDSGVVTETFYLKDDSYKAATSMTSIDKYGHKASHISASFGLAGITVALGHTTKDSNKPMSAKMKTNFLGASGSIGDTGLSWNAWGRNVKNNEHMKGDDRSPWTVGLAKSLGGGATTFIEHTNADDGEDGTTSVALRVDF